MQYEKDDEGFYRVRFNPHNTVIGVNPVTKALASLITPRVYTEPQSGAQCDLVGDSFFSLYRRDAQLRDDSHLLPSHKINRSIMEWAMNGQEYPKTVAKSAGNLPVALTTSQVFWEGLASNEALEEIRKQQEEAEKEEQKAMQAAQEAAEAAANGDKEGAEAKQAEAQKHMENAAAVAEQATDKLDALQENKLAQGMMNNVMKDAKEEGEKTNAMVKGWGLDPGSMSVEDATEIVQKSQEMNLKQLAEVLGQLRGVASATIDAVKQEFTGAVTEVTMTKDIEKLLPTELGYISQLSPPVLRAEKIDQLVSGAGLLGWKPKLTGEREGHFIAAVDESGSMNGTPILVAKAIILAIGQALLNDPTVQARYYEAFGFATEGDGTPTVTSNDGWKGHIDWANNFIMGGGTDFDFAIRESIKRLDAMDKPGADLLFITDEMARMTDETRHMWNEFRERTGSRLILIGITGRYGGSWSNDGDLQELCDLYIKTSHNDALDAASEIVAQITRFIAEGRM